MRLVKLSEVVGYEKLARPVMTEDLKELLAAGTVLKPEYVSRMEHLGITEVLIEDKFIKPEQILIIREDVEDMFHEKVKSVMERHIYSNNEELKELSKTADTIITNILESEDVIEQIYDIRERNADIYEHSISVCSMAVLLGAKMGLNRETLHDIGVASLFHDIGLRYLNFEYTNLSIEELSEKEKQEYKKHPANAYSSLEKETWLSKESKLIILQHHERMDGTGYPLHVKNPPISSQIVEVCDAFDEMICGIGCKRSRVYEAVEYLKIARGVQFSQEIVELLLEFTAVYPSGTLVSLSNGEYGVVIRQNKQFPERPVLRIVKDKDGKNITDNRECDLLEVRNLMIEKVIM